MKTNIIKKAECTECGHKLHRKDIKPDVNRQFVELIATCPNPACRHVEVIDRIAREQANVR